MKSVHFARFVAVTLIAGAFSTGNASAEPAPMPTTDFTAQWELTGGPDQMMPSRITYSHALNKMRIHMKMKDQEMTMIRDDMRRLLLIAGVLLVGMLALLFVLD